MKGRARTGSKDCNEYREKVRKEKEQRSADGANSTTKIVSARRDRERLSSCSLARIFVRRDERPRWSRGKVKRGRICVKKLSTVFPFGFPCLLVLSTISAIGRVKPLKRVPVNNVDIEGRNYLPRTKKYHVQPL